MLIDLDAFRVAPLTRDPFAFTVLKDAIRRDEAAEIRADFPYIADLGLLPVAATRPGPRFRQLVADMQSDEVARAFSEKFEVDLVGRPQMITVRGRCAARDGRIHTDSVTKVVTVLLYFNEAWEATGGRLRLLRSATNLNDAIGEVAPDMGTMVAFRRSDCSYHGHEPFEGVRRYLMINWMTNDFAAQRELCRHRISARFKQATSLFQNCAQRSGDLHV